MEQKTLTKNIFFNIIHTILGLIFPLITFSYSARILGPENLGKINFSQSIVSYFLIIADFGIGTYGIREVAKVRDDRQAVSNVVFEIFILNLLTSFFAYVIFFFVVKNIGKLADYRDLLYILSCSIVCTTFGLNWLYTAMEDYLYIILRSLAVNIISMVLLFIFVKESGDFVVYTWLIILSKGGANLFNFYHAKKYAGFPKKPYNVLRHFKPLCIFFVTVVTASLHTILDQTMIGIFVDDINVGLYASSIKIINMVIALVVSVSGVLLPRLSYFAKHDKNMLYNLLNKMIDMMLIISVPFVLGIFIESDNLIGIFCGQEFIAAIPIMRILSLLLIAVVFTNLIGNQVFVAIGREKYLLLATFIGMVCNLVLNYIFIPRFKAIGAAVTTVVSESIVLAIEICLITKSGRLRISIKSLLLSLLNSSVMIATVLLIKTIFHNALLSFCVSVGCGIIVYLCLLLMERNVYLYEILASFRQIVYRNNPAKFRNGNI